MSHFNHLVYTRGRYLGPSDTVHLRVFDGQTELFQRLQYKFARRLKNINVQGYVFRVGVDETRVKDDPEPRFVNVDVPEEKRWRLFVHEYLVARTPRGTVVVVVVVVIIIVVVVFVRKTYL